MIAREDVVTLDEVDGYETLRNFGRIRARASRPRNRLRSTFRSLGMLIGLSAGEFLSDAEHLRGEALEALRVEGAELGANAIVRVEFDVSEGADGSCLVVVSGEAVLVERDPGAKACPA
ncbi:MAG TPA: heavy metal-binding domain-containing protein [Candidatus Tumulicola sp.]